MKNTKYSIVFMTVFFLLLLSSNVFALDRLVPSGYPTIQAAIDAAADGDIVMIAPGTYTGNGNRDIDFKGKAITVCSENPDDPCVVAATVINCNGSESDPHRGFIFQSGEDKNSVLAGFAIKNGYAYNGAGVYCDSSNPIIKNCNFVNGTAEKWGGGAYCVKASPLILNCTFSNNSAFEGAAITSRSSWYYLCSPRIENCHIFGNIASGSGGGINSDCLSTPIISNCLINSNFAGTYGGGGISIFQSNPIITDCTITDNSTASSGGGILQWYEFENGSTITNCIVTDNNAMHFGGGVYGSQNCDMTITTSSIFGNKGELGGGVYCDYMHSLTMRNCTITNNYSEFNVFLVSILSGELKNNIIWSKMPNESLTVMGDIIVSYCDITGCCGSGPFWRHGFGIDGGGNIDIDPCFVSPGYWDANGTPDDANDDFWVDGDYHLLSQSACIDSGDPNYVAGPNETDLDGKPRIFGGRIDMGAYEFSNTPPTANAGPNQTAYAWIDGFAEVALDGSGSYDDDGDELSYLWDWTIDSNSYEANGVDPNIELPAGEHIIELVVFDGTEYSAPDQTLITVIGPLKSQLWVFPQTIIRHNNMRQIMVVLTLPKDITREQIDEEVPLALYPGGIEPMRQFIIGAGCGARRRPVQIFAFYSKAELMESVELNGMTELSAVGQLKTGRYFYGADTIRIINHPPRPILKSIFSQSGR